MESKYRIGDMVRILDPVPEDSWVGTNDFMIRQAGKITTIVDIFSEVNAHDGFIYKLDGMNGWNWESTMFEPAPVFELDNDDNDVCPACFDHYFDCYRVV